MRKISSNNHQEIVVMRYLVFCFMLFVFTTTVSGCSSCKEERTRVGLSDLNSNFEKWTNLGIETYVLTYSERNSFLPDYTSNRVVVELGEIIQVDILDGNGVIVEAVSIENLNEYYLAESLFDEINRLNSIVKDLTVQYNQEVGLPSYVRVNPNIGVDGCGDVFDDEYSITASIEF